MTNNPNLDSSLRRFATILSPEEIQALRRIQQAPLPTGIRMNPLKGEPKAVMQSLAERYHWKVESLSFCEDGWVITGIGENTPGSTIEHRLGAYYLQDAASMVPVSLFDFSSAHPLILDMAASPGGKTTHLISRCRDRGFVVANDASRSRVPALRAVLATWGGTNQIVTNFPGESFGTWYPETFDLILLDAPCSMENLRPTPNHPLRETTPDERSRLQARQIDLLLSGLRAVKTGGQLVYATCSLAPEEDEAVLHTVLQKFPRAVSIQNVSNLLPFSSRGLTRFQDQIFSDRLRSALRLWPHRSGMSGFFCALLQKTDSLPGEEGSPPKRDLVRTGLAPMENPLKSRITQGLKDQFGLHLLKILETHHLDLMQRQEQVFLIPQTYLDQFSELPYEYIGMPLGRLVQEQLEPAHEFISRFGSRATSGIIHITPQETRLWTAGRDIRHPQSDRQPKGQYLIVRDHLERTLGLGKLLPKRLRNMLPRTIL
jgi:16S rRNA (cytosine1407-C5)-methyltransferase